MTRRRHAPTALAMVVAVLLGAGCGATGHEGGPTHPPIQRSSAPTSSPGTTVAPPSHGTLPTAIMECRSGALQRGGPASAGFDYAGVTAPEWSGSVGYQPPVAGGRLISAGASCLEAIDVTTGRPLWSRRADGYAVTATATTVVLADLRTFGRGPALSYSVVSGLTGVDAATGRRLWHVKLALDGQALPALATSSTVVVTEADGAVVGLSPTTGRTVWVDPAPQGCRWERGSLPGASPLATPLSAPAGTSSPAPVVYDCAGPRGLPAERLAGIDPATGRVAWIWRVPVGGDVNVTQLSGVAGGVLGVINSRFPTVAPVRVSYPWLGSGTPSDQLVAIDERSGRPLWQADRVPTSSAVFGSAGRLCIASNVGVDCRQARTGSDDWGWVPSGTPGVGMQFSAAVSGSELFLVASTPAADAIPAESTTYHSAPGAFTLVAFDVRTGRRIEDQPLPSWSGGRRSPFPASLQNPPGVVAADSGTVVVSAEIGPGEVEAFPADT